MKILTKIFLTILPALYLGNAMGTEVAIPSTKDNLYNSLTPITPNLDPTPINNRTKALSTNTPKSSKKAPKATSPDKKNEMEENAIDDFCEPIQLTGKLADGKINEQCDTLNPTIKIMCYKTKNGINQEKLKKRYNNYCFSNMKNSVDIEQYPERSCTEEELKDLNAISCTKYDDGEDTNFLDIKCDNTNFAYSKGKCVEPKYTHSITLQIKDNTENIPIDILVFGSTYKNRSGIGSNECIIKGDEHTKTIKTPEEKITVLCTEELYYKLSVKSGVKNASIQIQGLDDTEFHHVWIVDTTQKTITNNKKLEYYKAANDTTPIVIKLKSSSNEKAEGQAPGDANDNSDDANNNKDAKVATVVTDPNTPAPNDPRWSEEEINAARDAAESARETENSDVNKMLGATGMGATGIGGMMLMQGLAEKTADDDATRAMQAYIATFNCEVGNNRVPGGATTEVPGGNELINLYGEYVNLANNVKEMKSELGLRPGIESEPILDSATSGLYDDVSVAGTSGAYASLARALMDPYGKDAAAWAEQTEKTSKNITTGAITAGTGAGVSLIGDLTNKAVEKKKAEKSEKEKKKKDKEEAE